MTGRMVVWAQILWPAFLVGGVLELVVFACVDPSMFHVGDWHPDTKTVYSLMFFVFWAIVAFGAFMSHWLISQAPEQAHR